MKQSGFLIFFSIVLAVYAAVNYYIFIRGWQAIPRESVLRTYYVIIFIFIALSYIIGRILERIYLSSWSDILVWIGSFWLAAMLYFFLIIVFLDLVRLVNHFVSFLPVAITGNYIKAKFMAGIITTGLVLIIVLIAFLNASRPRIRNLDLSLAKLSPPSRQLTLVAVSDIHLGTIVGKGRLNHLVERINQLSPDIVVLAGDIVDEDMAPVIREDLGAMLRNIKTRYGVYAITGNHEYYGGVESAVKYMRDHGIIVLRDSVAMIDNALYLIGRDDREKKRITGFPRRPLDTLLTGLDPALPKILLDHQPFGLEEAVKAGIDLQISGHTHNGQLWPFNYITRAVYEISSGHRKIERTDFYVSTGFGTWGPPARLGNRPEIVNIKLRL
jgi:predicted MPP superfamily phosphohydrolase